MFYRNQKWLNGEREKKEKGSEKEEGKEGQLGSGRDGEKIFSTEGVSDAYSTAHCHRHVFSHIYLF
jgi:hypothetical protein